MSTNTVEAVPFPDFPLNGKIVAITGGASGMGLAFAKLAHTKGAHVMIADIKLTADAEKFITETKEAAVKVIYKFCDVTKRADLEAMIEGARSAFGGVPDVYVAGAGNLRIGTFWDDPYEERGYALLDINAAHPIRLTRLAIRALLAENKKGVVVLISSLAGLGAYYAAPLYAASKHALVGFGRSMAQAERLQGVKVVTLCPGLVRTPIITAHPDLVDMFVTDDSDYIEPETTALSISSLIESANYPGGTVLEVLLSGQAAKVLAPILTITDNERGKT